jgi:hypothetical protein
VIYSSRQFGFARLCLAVCSIGSGIEMILGQKSVRSEPMLSVRICCTAIALLISTGTLSAPAQTAAAKPKSPGEIAAASRLLAEKRENCRRQAREQKLSWLKRGRFIRGCVKAGP